MGAVELVIPNLVSGALERRHKDSAAGVYAENLIHRAVGDENSGATDDRRRFHEPGREGEHVGKEIAVGQSHR